MKKIIALNTASASALLVLFSTSTLFAQSTPTLTDPEIASVAVIANQSDIDFARIAQRKSTNAEVLKFAETMARDHQAVIDQAVALVTKLHVTPKANAVGKKMAADAANNGKMLAAKSKASFDKAYIDNEVAYHKAVIAAVETILIPQADNAELKALLQNVVPALKAHLQHAEMLQRSVASK